MIDYDPREFMQGLNTQSLLFIAALLGEDVAQSLEPEVVPIDVEHHSVSGL